MTDGILAKVQRCRLRKRIKVWLNLHTVLLQTTRFRSNCCLPGCLLHKNVYITLTSLYNIMHYFMDLEMVTGKICISLTHCSLVDFSTLIYWKSRFAT